MKTAIESIELNGLRLAPAQFYGSLCLVPVLRDEPAVDFRLDKRSYGGDWAVVSLTRGHEDEGLKYYSYIPHAFVASWTNDGSPVAEFGVRLERSDAKKSKGGAQMIKRMLRREGGDRLRFLPLHVALEGYLSLHFGGPDMAWSEYSRQAMSAGLDPRCEVLGSATFVPGLDEALRVFEIHDSQVGVLVFTSELLASAFIVPHPDDYRALHRSLLADLYAEFLYYYGIYGQDVSMPYELDENGVGSLSDLRRAVDDMRGQWESLYQSMAGRVFDCPVRQEMVYRAGPFSVNRFITDLDPAAENHIGESITRADGTLEYLKTFRLSAAQTRRAYLLSKLAECGWNITAAAAELNQSHSELVLRIKNAGFGYLLHDHVIKRAQKIRFGHGDREC